MHEDDLATKLTDFGLTINQAKVYLNVVQCRRTRVGAISKNTQLHRQDIYKLLPKLEKMGLVTRTIGKPFMIEALPPEKALGSIIAKEKDQCSRRLARLEKSLKEVTEAIHEQPEIKEESRFTLLTTDEAMDNQSNLTLKKKPKNFMIISTLENLRSQAGNYYKGILQMIADSKAKSRLIIVTSESREEIRQVIEKVAPKHGSFNVKVIQKSPSKEFQVVDDREVWIATQQKTRTGYPSILWTNDRNIVEAYLENFNDAWNNEKAVAFIESNSATSPHSNP